MLLCGQKSKHTSELVLVWTTQLQSVFECGPSQETKQFKSSPPVLPRGAVRYQPEFMFIAATTLCSRRSLLRDISTNMNDISEPASTLEKQQCKDMIKSPTLPACMPEMRGWKLLATTVSPIDDIIQIPDNKKKKNHYKLVNIQQWMKVCCSVKLSFMTVSTFLSSHVHTHTHRPLSLSSVSPAAESTPLDAFWGEEQPRLLSERTLC